MNIIDLQDPSRYRLIKAMPLDELKPFVIENIKKKNKYARCYKMLTYLVLILTVALFWFFPSENEEQFKDQMLYFGIGFLLCFTVLIIVHELIHGITYKMVGAPKVSYGGSLKEFVFYAAANKFIADRAAFFKVALAPFVVISILSIVTFLAGDVYYQWLAIGVLVGHTLLCGGDFAMLSFFEEHKEKEMFTYDDMENKVMYFYEKIKY